MATTMLKNWQQECRTLTLDLYFRNDRGSIDARNPNIIELSEILNKLPIHDYRPDEERFRNVNGVTLKLSNFLAIDPDYEGDGMKSYSKLDKELFFEFSENRKSLRKLAEQILKVTADDDLRHDLSRIEVEDGIVDTAKEGAVMYKLHRLRERNRNLVYAKKQVQKKKYGRLFCELCKFDFEEKYGDVGKDFIECHHVVPLSKLTVSRENSISDLLLVCSNCHRMLHRGLRYPPNDRGESQTKGKH